MKPPRARDGFVGVSTGARNDDAVPMDVGIDAESAARYCWIDDDDCRTMWTFSDGGVSSTTKRVDDDDDVVV